MGWYIILEVGLLLLLILIIVRLTVEFRLCKNDGEDFLWVKFGIGPWQFTSWKTTSLCSHLSSLIASYLKHPAPNSNSAGFFPGTKLFVAVFLSFLFKILSNPNLIKLTYCNRLEWSTRIGLGNPALTGIIVGGLWPLKHRLYRFLSESTAGMSALPKFEVLPDFGKAKLELEFVCIFACRGGHIIIATCYLCWSALCSLLRGEKN